MDKRFLFFGLRTLRAVDFERLQRNNTMENYRKLGWEKNKIKSETEVETEAETKQSEAETKTKIETVTETETETQKRKTTKNIKQNESKQAKSERKGKQTRQYYSSIYQYLYKCPTA